MLRRTLLSLTAGALAAPNIARAATDRVLRFIPQADLAVLDPVWTSAFVTRNHAFMVFDTLFGLDGAFKAQPQMLAGAVASDDDRRWTLTLRDGLMFHDGTPVLARDCVSSIRRWGVRDAFGQALLAATDDLAAEGDKTIVFRLKAPFRLLPDALGKAGPSMCPVMPERLARTDPFKQITEMVGSGPFRFKADERVSGSRVVYERFAGYKPRESGAPEWTAGPKLVHFERVEWTVIPDTATAAAAMRAGEMDWWEKLDFDQQATLERNPKLAAFVVEVTGNLAFLRMNQLFPPFDNPDIRRALLSAVNQADYMAAVAGEQRGATRTDVGFFTPGTPMASAAGMQALAGPRDMDKVRRDLKAAGYKGERVVVMVASDFPTLTALGHVGVDMLQRCGLNLDVQETDWGTIVQRRASKAPPEKGGWNVFFSTFSGLDMASPATSHGLRGNGDGAWFGWPTAPGLEMLRDQWLTAPDLTAQQRIAAAIQVQASVDVPFLPLGVYFQSTLQQRTLTGTLRGLPVFWNVRRA